MAFPGLALLLTAAAWATSGGVASGLVHRAGEAGGGSGEAEGEEETLRRPLKVFTLFDRSFTRIARVWRDCLTRAIPRPLASMSVEAKEISKKGLVLLEVEKMPHQRLPPPSLSHMLMNEWAKKLSASDTLHIDADAFLLQDPVRGTTLKYPEADIIAAVDCVHDQPTCSWYRSHAYLQRNNFQDPLQAQGFMLNTGFMYMRSMPATMNLLSRAIDLTGEGENEQVALNEVLLNFGCNWTAEDGSPAPSGPEALEFLQGGALRGSCGPGLDSSEEPEPPLSVVVLPYSDVPRGDDVRYRRGTPGPNSLAYHPGGRLEYKEHLLGRVRRLCMSRKP